MSTLTETGKSRLHIFSGIFPGGKKTKNQDSVEQKRRKRLKELEEVDYKQAVDYIIKALKITTGRKYGKIEISVFFPNYDSLSDADDLVDQVRSKHEIYIIPEEIIQENLIEEENIFFVGDGHKDNSGKSYGEMLDILKENVDVAFVIKKSDAYAFFDTRTNVAFPECDDIEGKFPSLAKLVVFAVEIILNNPELEIPEVMAIALERLRETVKKQKMKKLIV